MLELDHKLLGIANPLDHVVVRPLFSFDLWGIEIVVSNLIETVCSFICQEVAGPFLGDRTDKYIGLANEAKDNVKNR